MSKPTYQYLPSFSAWKSRSDFLRSARLPPTEETLSQCPRLHYIALSIFGVLYRSNRAIP
jgi:hypothetical protein